MRKRNTIIPAIALTGALTVGATPALASEPAHNPGETVAQGLDDAAKKAFDTRSESTYTSNPTFNAEGVTEGMGIDWAIPISTSQELINFIAPSDERFRNALENPKPVEEYKEPVGAPTPALAVNGDIVVVLPHDGATTVDGGVRVDGLQSGDHVQMTEHEDSTVPVASPSGAIKLLFSAGGGQQTTTLDPTNGATLSVQVNSLTMNYLPKNARSTEDVEELVTLSGSALSTTNFNPGDNLRLAVEKNVSNLLGSGLKSIIEPLTVAPNAEQDKSDGQEDGLTPLRDEDNRPISAESDLAAGTGDNQSVVEFTVPDDGLVYLNHRVVDGDNNNVVPQRMETMTVAEPTMDAQASTQSGTSQLDGDGEQTIYNQVALNNLTPGKPYQVLVNLFQCDGSGDCTEIAAVNREIVPGTASSVQNFSVLIDPTKLASNDSTLEWETRMYEGTGDIYDMGPVVTEIADRGENQVVSPSGSRVSLAADRNEQSGTVMAQGEADTDDGAPSEVSPDEGLPIGDEAPPADIGEVRGNNEAVDERESTSEASSWVAVALAVIVAVILLVALVVVVVNVRRKRRSQRATEPTENLTEDGSTAAGDTIIEHEGNDMSGGDTNGR